MAEHRAAILEPENRQLRRDLNGAESYAMEFVQEVWLLGGEPDALRRHSIQNVEWSTPQFKRLDVAGPPMHYRVVRNDDSPRWVSQIISPMNPAIDQGMRPELVDVFAFAPHS